MADELYKENVTIFTLKCFQALFHASILYLKVNNSFHIMSYDDFVEEVLSDNELSLDEFPAESNEYSLPNETTMQFDDTNNSITHYQNIDSVSNMDNLLKSWNLDNLIPVFESK